MATAELALPRRASPALSGPTTLGSYPFFGVFSVTLGTALAQLFVPAAFHQPWAMFTPTLCMVIAIMLPVLFAAAKEFRTLLRAELVMTLEIGYWSVPDLRQGVNTPRV